MNTQKPGTIYRAYNTDKTAHNTALQIRDGTVLEIKASDNKPKAQYTSYDAWVSERGLGGPIETDTTRSRGAIISEKHGFNVPPRSPKREEQYNNTGWLYWCFDIMNAEAPELLMNPAVRDAYNALAEICVRYGPNHLRTYGDLRKDCYYCASNLKWHADDAMHGFPGYFRNHQPEANKRELTDAYKLLYDLIAPSLHPIMKRNQNIIKKEQEITSSRSYLKKLDKWIKNHESGLVSCTESKKRYLDILAKQQEQLKSLSAQ